MMSTSSSACFRATSSTARATRASSSTSSYGLPASLACSSGMRSSGRGRLPTCVVRMRLLLRFINTLLRHGSKRLERVFLTIACCLFSKLFHLRPRKPKSLDRHFFPTAAELQGIVAVQANLPSFELLRCHTPGRVQRRFQRLSLIDDFLSFRTSLML